jgi:hypothetical protein
MQAFFDQQQQKLADAIDPETNTVGHFVEQIYGPVKGYAQGGAVDPGLSETGSDLGIMQKIIGAANKSTTGADATASGGRYGDSPLGQGFYNSAPYIASHYTQLGKFFGPGTEPGNKYSDHFTQPQKSQPVQSQNPEDFYARFYNRMRNMAQAEEIANRGQTTVKST